MKNSPPQLVLRTLLITPLLLIGALAGCRGGPDLGPTVEVSGKVTLDGEPISESTVWFSCLRSGTEFNAKLDPDGTYALSIPDVEIGETYGVFIGGIEPEEGEEDEDGNPKASIAPKVPAKYLEGSTSGLTATIDKESGLTLDFELTSK